MNADELSATTATDTVEADQLVWTRSRSSATVRGFERLEQSPVEHWWFGPTEPFPSDASLISPLLEVSNTAPLSIRFRHRYDIEETWDGGVIEISADGQTWQDVTELSALQYPSAVQNLANNPNPLNGRPSFSGRNPSHPAGTSSRSTSARHSPVRTCKFAFGWGPTGRLLPQAGRSTTSRSRASTTSPFASVVSDRGQCINRPPVADAGFDRRVREREPFQLDASQSSDPDNDTLGLEWLQVAGPTAVSTSSVGSWRARSRRRH
ncbi:MAG: hypothetical protein HC923_12925 [Myxococcales bacterium]|nr:hypothetical protein [Myxococcales bacterium]